jgi:hypothetical protein
VVHERRARGGEGGGRHRLGGGGDGGLHQRANGGSVVAGDRHQEDARVAVRDEAAGDRRLAGTDRLLHGSGPRGEQGVGDEVERGRGRLVGDRRAAPPETDAVDDGVAGDRRRGGTRHGGCRRFDGGLRALAVRHRAERAGIDVPGQHQDGVGRPEGPLGESADGGERNGPDLLRRREQPGVKRAVGEERPGEGVLDRG